MTLQVPNNTVKMVQERPSAVVVGLGRSGFASVRFLRDKAYRVSVVDSRTRPPMQESLIEAFPDVPLLLGFSEKHFHGADIVVVSPGVSINEPVIRSAHAAGAQIIGDVELFARHAAAPVLAITGSNGKSTVTALVGEMFREAGIETAVGGNIGVPVLQLLDPERTPPGWYVLELSSFQLETTGSLNPRASVILNLSPDHMDRYPSFEAYARAKTRIFRGNGIAVVNRDDPVVWELVPKRRPTRSFGRSAPGSDVDFGVLEYQGVRWLAQGRRRLMPSAEIPLIGTHNVSNVLAAMTLASLAEIPPAAMVRATRRFQGLHHRTELVLEQDGVRWVNDSKATNVGATVAALEGVEAPVVLIAGGDAKGANFSPLKPLVAKRVRMLLLIGRDADAIAAAVGDGAPCRRVSDLNEAVRVASAAAVAGDIVMLSPACASFDMFDNFEHRGDVFRQLVRELTR